MSVVKSAFGKALTPALSQGERGNIRNGAKHRAPSIGWVCLSMIFVFALTVQGGCRGNPPRERAAVRKARMENYWSQFKKKEKERPEAMEEVVELDRRMQKRHAEKLKSTQKMIEKRYAQELKDWRANEPKRKAQAKKLFKAKPEEIPDTYRTLTD